ncbi:MAG: hypothetical protein AAF907_01175, partial [Planctomycetota bacterium]
MTDEPISPQILSAEGPTDLSLPAVAGAAWASYRTFGGRLAGAVLLAGMAWVTFGCVSGGFLFGLLSAGNDAIAYLAIGIWFLGMWSVASVLLHGLAGACLAAARGWVGGGEVFSPPQPWRAILCGVPTVLFQAVLKWVPVFFLVSAAPFAARDAWGMAGFAVGQCAPPILFALLWPALFLMHDRPTLTALRPLAAGLSWGEGSRRAATA